MPGVLKNIEYGDPVIRYRGQKILDNLKKLNPQSSISLELAIDVYYSLYLPLPMIEEPEKVGIALREHYKVVHTALNDEEFRKLRYHTVADSFASVAIGTLFLLNLLEENSLEQEYQAQSGSKELGGRSQDQEKKREENAEGSKSKDLEDAVKNAIRRTLEHAETIKELQHFVYGYRAGIGHVLDLDDDVTTTLKLVKNTDIKKILMMLARLPDIRCIVKKRKVSYQRGEVEGYTIGADIERIVPTELAYPTIYLYTKIADGKLLLYNKVLYMSMGPLYVLIDKSGSMDGNKILWAKATALALLMRSRLEKRAFYVRFFDSEPYKLMKIKSNATPSDVLKIIEYIASVRNGGGTDISKTVITACNDIMKLRSKDVSDLIIITDGEDRIAKSLVKKSLAYAKARLISVMIMGDNKDLKDISSYYFKVTKLSEKEIISVVEVE